MTPHRGQQLCSKWGQHLGNLWKGHTEGWDAVCPTGTYNLVSETRWNTWSHQKRGPASELWRTGYLTKCYEIENSVLKTKELKALDSFWESKIYTASPFLPQLQQGHSIQRGEQKGTESILRMFSPVDNKDYFGVVTMSVSFPFQLPPSAISWAWECILDFQRAVVH